MEKVRLGDIFEYLPKSKLKAGDGRKKGKYKFFTSSNIQDKYIDEFIYDGEYLIFGTGGKASINYCNEKFSTSTDNFVVKVNKEFYTKLIYLYFKNDMSKLEKGFKGASIKHISKEYINQLTIPKYNYENQLEIVSKLDKVQEIIDIRKKQIEELDELIKSQFVEMFGNPIINDKKLNYVKIGDIAKKEKNAIKAGPFGSSLKKELYVPSGYKIYGQEQVIADDVEFGDYHIDEAKFNELRAYEVKENDILISLVGTYGKVLIMPKKFEKGIINPRVMKISPDVDKINPYFFKILFGLISTIADNYTHGGTMGILNVGIVKNIKIILPDIEEQNKYIKILEQINKQKNKIQKSLEEMRKLQASLMNKYFN